MNECRTLRLFDPCFRLVSPLPPCSRPSIYRETKPNFWPCDQIVLCSLVTTSLRRDGVRRTGPGMHKPKSLASPSWPSRPYRASGQPSWGKRLHRQQDALGDDGSSADTGTGAYKSVGMRIARSDGGNRPSSRFPGKSLQPIGSSTPAVASRLTIICEGRRGGAQNFERSQRGDGRRHAAGEAVLVEDPAPQRTRWHTRLGRKTAPRRRGVTGRPA
jgi:hypothetical protein